VGGIRTHNVSSTQQYMHNLQYYTYDNKNKIIEIKKNPINHSLCKSKSFYGNGGSEQHKNKRSQKTTRSHKNSRISLIVIQNICYGLSGISAD
jgi:hypothetical protein